MPKGFSRTALALVAATVCGAAMADDAKLVKRSYPVGGFVVNFPPAHTPPPVVVQTVDPVRLASAPTPPPARQSRPEARPNAEALARLLVNTVKPYSWEALGGAGRVTYDEESYSLVVVQTADAHAHIADLLASMRRVQAASTPAVQLDLTAVEVPESFFETAGGDGGACVKTVGASEPACPKGEMCQAMKAVRTADGVKPVAVLSDAQVRSLVEHARADRRASVQTNPKLSMFDMQTSHLWIGELARHLTGLELTAGPNGVERKPRYQTVQLGTTIRATPTVSADRRFVLLRLDYHTTRPNAVAPAKAVKVGEGPEAEVLAFPSLVEHQFRSIVVIPAGKTVLLPGPVETREERTESGPPVLAKVPNVNKLCPNVGTGRTKYRHLLLVTANVMNSDDDGCPAADGKACPAACEAVAVAKPARPADAEASRLVAAYHKACADGRSEDALRLAMQALARDPNCFAVEK